MSSEDYQPVPYSEVMARLARLESDLDLKGKLISAYQELAERSSTPEVTVSHDQLADGTWRYKTSVTLKPESLEALPESLAWVDAVARREAERREAQDQSEGRVFSKPRAPRGIGSASNG
jgi:hypothetical protein